MVSTVADKASTAASSVGQAAGSGQQKVREQAKGSPLAVGRIAFGVGVVTSSLLPPSSREKQLAGQVKDRVAEHGADIKQQVGEAAGT